VPLVLASIQRRIDNLAVAEFADLSQRDSPDLLFRIMGYGKEPGAFDQRRWAHGTASFGPSLHLVAEALGVPLDEVTSTGEVAVASRPLTIAAGEIPEGTVAAQRMIVNGLRDGHPLLTFSATWYCSRELDPAWDVRDTGWRITVDGDAPLDIEIRFPIPLDRMAATTPAYTANRAVNAIRSVCAATPGIRTTLDLPHILPRLL
jgi:4-hydroxy-tetrahydrodipicolinate reductase